MSETTADAGTAGWTLVQLAELVRRAEELLLDGITLVGPQVHADMAADTTIALSADEVRHVGAALSEGVELAEQLELLTARLPDGPVDADHDAVCEAAAADLARGIVDPRRALVAARVLDVERGWPALADSLTAGDVVAAWGDLTVERLLGRFRGADPHAVERVAAEAGLVEPDAPFSTCSPGRLAALAEALRAHAKGHAAP